MPNIEEFAEALKLAFSNLDLLQQVFVHRSYINEHRTFPLGHNERLEFLGDAVLELVVTEFLYKNYENPEGELTNWRSALVKGEKLAEIATGLGFGEMMLFSHGEAKSGGKNKNLLLANAFEALLGALYLDKGYEACRIFVETHLISHLPEILEKGLYIDPKSRLQEVTQERFNTTPTYQVLSEEGPDHAKEFVVAALLGEKELAQGTGSSKQSAQIAAAANALSTLVTPTDQEN